jgi:hypothetical protein
MGAYKVGYSTKIKGETVSIIEKIKGGKTNNPNYQSGVLFCGFKSNPCTYLLSNGMRVRGSTLNQIESK